MSKSFFLLTYAWLLLWSYNRTINCSSGCNHISMASGVQHAANALFIGFTGDPMWPFLPLVLAITAGQCLNISELWIAFKSFQYLAIHEMTRALQCDLYYIHIYNYV